IYCFRLLVASGALYYFANSSILYNTNILLFIYIVIFSLNRYIHACTVLIKAPLFSINGKTSRLIAFSRFWRKIEELPFYILPACLNYSLCVEIICLSIDILQTHKLISKFIKIALIILIYFSIPTFNKFYFLVCFLPCRIISLEQFSTDFNFIVLQTIRSSKYRSTRLAYQYCSQTHSYF